MFARLFSGIGIIESSLSSFGICGLLACLRQQLLQQGIPSAQVETLIDIPLVLLTVKSSPSLIPGVFMCVAFGVGGALAENQRGKTLNAIKNACALGLYFVCGDDASLEYQAAKFVCATSAALLSYEAVDAITARLHLPTL